MIERIEPGNSCPVCTSDEILRLLTIQQAPIFCNLLWQTRDGAVSAPRGDIDLGFCSCCGHIYNLRFEPELMAYSESYENSLHFSPRFQEYAKNLAERLVGQYDLNNKDIVEIGSGQGDFLKMLCEIGNNRGAGFDPSYVPEDDIEDRVEFVPEYYSEKFSHYKADFILSRHVLEHIAQPDEFIAMLRRVIGERKNVVVFFEVPNALFTIREKGIWDLIYEHFSYFTPNSLAEVFRRNGFEVIGLSETFNGQFLTIEARPVSVDSTQIDKYHAQLAALTQDANRFGENYADKVESWEGVLKRFAREGKKVVIWGAGSKGVTFLNIHRNYHSIEYVVDINPRKNGMFVAGSGEEIVFPEFLAVYQPDFVIIMNPNYQDEIKLSLENLGVHAQLLLA